MKLLVLSLLIAIAVVAFSCNFLSHLAHRVGLVDSPKGRKRHTQTTPLIGGISMFLGLSFALLTMPISLHEYRFFWAGLALLVITGVLDDFKEISANYRLLMQLLAATLMVVGAGGQLQSLGDLLFIGDLNLGVWGIVFTIIAVVGIINAINMLDGLDGLAGSISLVIVLWMVGITFWLEGIQNIQVLLLVAAVLVTFLFFNFRISEKRKASVFMGDAGSMMLGFCLAWFAVGLSQEPSMTIKPVTVLWLFLLPLFDMFSVVINRTMKKGSPLEADRRHFHHLLRYKKFSVTKISIIMVLIALMSGGIGFVGEYWAIADGYMFASFIVAFLLFMVWLNLAWKKILSHLAPR